MEMNGAVAMDTKNEEARDTENYLHDNLNWKEVGGLE